MLAIVVSGGATLFITNSDRPNGGDVVRTGAVLANWWWLGRPYGLDRGFEHYDHRRGTSPPVYRRASKITDEGIDWLSRSDDRPFFLMLNYMDPHIPYAAPAPYDRRFDERSSPPPLAKPWTFWIRAQRQVLRTGRALDRDLHRFMVDRYDGEIAYLDEHVGRLLNWLREADLYANTLIILTTDHGEAFGEHGVAGHGVAMYETELDVAMIVKLPGRGPSGRVDTRVQHTDVLPTVLDVLNLSLPEGVQGVSMLSAEERDLIAVSYPRETLAALRPELDRTQWVFYRNGSKLIEYSDGTYELYDLDRDPAEQQDLAPSDAALVHELRAALLAVREEIPVSAPRPAEVGELDEMTLERLRSLGYAE